MSSNIIYPHGGLGIDITIPIGESIVVYTKDVARVYQIINNVNQQNLIGTVTDSEVVFGPYLDSTTIQINAGTNFVLYKVSTSPAIIEHKSFRIQEPPYLIIEEGDGKIPGEAMLNGIVILDIFNEGAVLKLGNDATLNMSSMLTINGSFEWSIVNVHPTNPVTVDPIEGNHLFGNNIIQGNSSTTFRTRRFQHNHFDTYRLT